MTRTRSFAVRAASAAPPAAVFGVLADGAGWTEWAGPLVPRSRWARTGTPPPGGVGAVRVLGRRPLTTREEIVEYVPDHRLTWTVRGGGLPVRDYRVSVDLDPSADGTVMVWTAWFRPALSGTGRPVQAALRLALATFAHRLAVAADRRTRTASTAETAPTGSGT
jgi:uncharacterized protein YndB with AHSA1/START domain